MIQNSPHLSVLKVCILFPESCSTNDLNFLKASLFLFPKNRPHILEWSPIKTKIYLFPGTGLSVIGPQRSPWISSNILSTRYEVACHVFFPSKHEPQTFLSKLMCGIPRTSSLCTLDLIVLRFKCPNLHSICLNHYLRSKVRTQCLFPILTLYTMFFDLFALRSSFPSWSCMVKHYPFSLISHPTSVGCPRLMMLLFKSGIQYASHIVFGSPCWI